jgi:WD40 repeat protein
MTLQADTRLGPYEVLDRIGAGGMGEVYRARDPRLGREVAVKVLPGEVARDPERLQRFEREARAVAALNHPNVLTIFDVGTHEGVPHVVTELLQGETLRELVSRRSPTQRQVLSFAVQVAQGLEAAHEKGIVHRDVKPENVFVTTDGRVKLLDFGLAKVADRLTSDSGEVTESSPTGAGQLMGTVAYMSPEQVRGLAVDHRTDLFSLGVVLYELLGGTHPFRRETTVATLTAILEETPAGLASLGRGIPPALGGIVARCLEKDRGQRFRSAHDLALSLEAVLQAPAGAASLQEVEEKSPYPGLLSFTEKDAAFFFGREEEIQALWQRLRGRRLLAVIGPSGAGKTSFLRAGVIAARPEGWGAAWAAPGARPALGLAQALTPELAGDAEAMSDLLRGVSEVSETGEGARAVSAVRRWRARHGEALLVIDQFEELFTLSPKETQARFAALLGRLASEADVHVVLSLRDDFLIRCSEHAPLAPVFESLTPLAALTADGLRRALVEPARKRGYGFEDEALVEEMVDSVEGARSALPLLAFAVSRLWEKRDRQSKRLTRAAYEEIGGLAGALAQHAEATMDRIGAERQGVVREIFRNLVTAQGTRAVAERDELLSAFPERPAAEDVLRELIDARLVTSYEVEGKEREPSRHRVEVVHESLLKAWPRLVRWQTQDEEGAQLRDQLKQAAHLWEERGRRADLLWSGTSFREYELWRERYAGGLTALEEAYAKAMVDRAQRQRRLRRLAVGSVVAAALVVAGVTGTLWRRSEVAREQAKAEALRAEAGKLLALARGEIDRYPTAALAYVRGSLDLADTADARRFAVEVLWRGPVARVLPLETVAGEVPEQYQGIALSPDGAWLAAQTPTGRLMLLPRDGGNPRSLAPPGETRTGGLSFSPGGDLLLSRGPGASVRLLSVPGLDPIRQVELGGAWSAAWWAGESIVSFSFMPPPGSERLVRSWPPGGGAPRTLARLDPEAPFIVTVDAGQRWLVRGLGRRILRRSLEDPGRSREGVVGELAEDVVDVRALGRDGLASIDKAGEVRLWTLPDGTPPRVLGTTGGLFRGLHTADRGGRLLAAGDVDASVRVWDLREPVDAEPLVLRRPEKTDCLTADFDGTGTWLAANNCSGVAFWPVGSPRRRTLRGHRGLAYDVAFSPDGQWLAACTPLNPVHLWPLDPAKGGRRPLLPARPCFGLTWDPTGKHLLEGTTGGEALLYPFRGGPPRPLPTGWEGGVSNGTCAMAFDASGRRAAATPMDMNPSIRDPKLRALRVFDLETGEARTHSLASLTDASWIGFMAMRFAPDGRLLAAGQGGVRRLTLPSDPSGTLSSETLLAAGQAGLDLSADGRTLLVWSKPEMSAPNAELRVLDLATGASRRITSHGRDLYYGAIDPSGRIIATGDTHGVVRVGPVTGEEPHLLLGHEGTVYGVAISPDGRWIASAGDDVLHLWPMPDVTKPPLHTLPHAELIAKLEALTNLRVVRDPASSTGWKMDLGPFPGWQDVPTW